MRPTFVRSSAWLAWVALAISSASAQPAGIAVDGFEEDLTGAKVPLHFLVDLAPDGGWSVDEASEPSTTIVDHVRIYAKE